MKKTKKIIYQITLTAVFTALCFAGTSIFIPVGITKIHLGNFVCVLAGMLCGGLMGGISGSIGMGLNDILVGGYGPDTWIRTIIVKFILGYLAGALFRLFIKRKPETKNLFTSIIFIFGVAFAVMLGLYIAKGDTFTIGGRTFKNSLFLVISLGIVMLFYVLLLLFSKKLSQVQQYVLINSALILTINVLLEFFIKIPFKMAFAGMNFEQATIYALTSLPGALFTMVLTIIFITLIFMPLYYATEKVNKLNDLYQSIQELSTKNNE